MRDRYTTFLTAVTSGASRSPTVSISFDLRKLIPVSERGSTFLLTTSFSTETIGAVDLGGIEVNVELPNSRNKSYPETNMITVGVAQPINCLGMNGADSLYKYAYQESEGIPVVIQYPEVYEVNTKLIAQNAVNIPDATYFTLSLAFEKL